MNETGEVLALLTNQNPWWSAREFNSGIPRQEYLNKMKEIMSIGQIVALNGVRRSGKTTLLFQLIEDLLKNGDVEPKKILFASCDHPYLMSLDDPLRTVLEVYWRNVFGGPGSYLILDEVQELPGWERWVKTLYDGKTYHLLISGSSSRLLDSRLSSLIGGRYVAVPVFPLDFREFLHFEGHPTPLDELGQVAERYRLINSLNEFLEWGGFPQVVDTESESGRRELLRSYYDSIVHRDIILPNEIRTPRALQEMIYYLFTNICSPFTYRGLSHTLGVDTSTLKEYLGYAREARILFEVEHFSYSLKVRSRNPRKIYCIDNGLRNTISFRFSADSGRLAENLVFLELKKRYGEVFYWKGKGEVDFAIRNRDGTLTPINVTYTDSPPAREIDSLLEFEDEHGGSVKNPLVITSDLEDVEEGVRMLPLWKWLLAPAPTD